MLAVRMEVLKRRWGRQQDPSEVEFVEQPKTESGKIQRFGGAPALTEGL